jgi:hypothetical protein
LASLEKTFNAVRPDPTPDPRTDPQPGDEVRDTLTIRRVIRRDGDMLICESWQRRYRMRVHRWQKWCEEKRAQAEPPNQDG